MKKLLVISLMLFVFMAGCNKSGNTATSGKAESTTTSGKVNIDEFAKNLQTSIAKREQGVTLSVKELGKVPNSDYVFVEVTFYRNGTEEGKQKVFTNGKYLTQDLLDVKTMASMGKELDLATAKPIEIDTKPLTLVMGDKNAKTVIVEITDFQCPYCKVASKYFKDNYAKRNDIAVYIVHLPLQMHPNAETMAKVFEAGAMMGKNFAQSLFESKYTEKLEAELNKLQEKNIKIDEAKFKEIADKLNKEIVEDYAKQSGNPEQFKKNLESEEVKNKLAKSLEIARQVGANSTPTFVINGKIVSGFDQASIEKLINNKK